MKKTASGLISIAALLGCSISAQAQDITKSMTVTGNHVGAFNVNAHVTGPTQTVKMQSSQAMFNKSGAMGSMSSCPDDKGTPTPDIKDSPTTHPPGTPFSPFPVPPMGVQQTPGGGSVSVFPGGTAVTIPSGGGAPLVTPPGLGEDKNHGEVIARQVKPDGRIIQVYSDGFLSVTRGGTTRFSRKAIF